MTTSTTFAQLSKPDDYQVGWGELVNANFDTIDQGISIFKLTNAHGATVPAYAPVKFGASAGQFLGSILSTTGIPCDGILLADTLNGETGTILSRGFVENSGWAWSIGDVLYLTSVTLGTGIGSFAVRGTTHAIEGATDSTLLMQPVGIAVSATRVYFDINRFRTLHPYTVAASGYIKTGGAGTIAEAFGALAGIGTPGTYHTLQTSGGAVDVVYTFMMPPWFKAMPNIAGVWGFRIGYKLGSGTIDVTQVTDGTNHSGDPTVSTGSSTTWAYFDVDWDRFNVVSGWAPAAGRQISVKVAISAAGADLDRAPLLRFEPMPTAFV